MSVPHLNPALTTITAKRHSEKTPDNADSNPRKPQRKREANSEEDGTGHE